MATYTAKDFKALAERIKGKDKIVLRASQDTINKSATFARRESIDEIVKMVHLSPTYVAGGLRVAKRASPGDLTAIVRGNVRATLLERYPYSISGDIARVQVNKTGGSLTIKGARMVNLKGSGEKVLGMFNKDFMETLSQGLNKGEGSTPGKRKKLYQVEKAAAKAPYGRWPLHSRSINQMFTDVRVKVQPQVRRFMLDTFIKDFNRLNK